MIIVQTSLLGSTMIVVAINFLKNGNSLKFLKAWFDNLLGTSFESGLRREMGLWILLGLIIAAVGIIFQYKTRTNEKEIQKLSHASVDPLILHIPTAPQFPYQQQPYGFPNSGYIPNGPYPHNGYPNNGYFSNNGHQNMPASGVNVVQNIGDSNAEDYQRVEN